MASRLNPYFSFPDGRARAAMERYREIFGGELTISTFAEGGGLTGEGADGVMHAQLETPEGYTLMASDTPPGMPAEQLNGGVNVSLSGDEGTLRGYWDGLAQGGQVVMPLERQIWGDTYGMLVDEFGVSWMVNIADPA